MVARHQVVSSLIPFPNILWWIKVLETSRITFDAAEHFQKMSYRNRYYITGSNGLITLSIPLVQGREQRNPMNNVLICNDTAWQVQHWRTLMSVYKRSPYFDHYESELQPLFNQPFTHLAAFNLASIHWLKDQLGTSFDEITSSDYIKDYGESFIDLRSLKPKAERRPLADAAYYQLFSERNGFLSNLSILDLLFSKGPHTVDWLKQNRDTILNWQ
jgi:hypothetical protein